MSFGNPRVTIEKLLALGLDLLDGSSSALTTLADEARRWQVAQLFAAGHLYEGYFLRAASATTIGVSELQASWLDVLRQQKPLGAHLGELGARFSSAAAYRRLVETLGKQLFGSATFAGETVLWEDEVHRLCFLPPTGSLSGCPAVFFLGGFIPYGDRVFRFLPEKNLYDRFLSAGIPVYVMELRGDREQLGDLRAMTLARLIDTIDQAAGVALSHNGGKLIASGYCGTGLHLLAYLAARPKAAEAKIATAALFMTPVDGRKCPLLSALVSDAPRSLWWLLQQRLRWKGAMSGLELWAGLDLGLKNIFVKTPSGRFATGWQRPGFATVHTLADLTADQRFDLADDYWTSIDNAVRYPIPTELVLQAASHFERGVDTDGALHYDYNGQRLNVRAVAQQTTIEVDGFFGGTDKVITEASGRVLEELLGDRYVQHVDPNASHISYIDSPQRWRPDHPQAFDPNPIEVLLARYASKH